MIRVRIGEADVTLGGDEHTTRSDDGHRRVSVTYEFDDVLHAATRVGVAALSSDDGRYVVDALSTLRRDLAARAEARRVPQ